MFTHIRRHVAPAQFAAILRFFCLNFYKNGITSITSRDVKAGISFNPE